MALVGRRVLLEYDVAGPRVWHERLVLEWVREENYVVVTPTGTSSWSNLVYSMMTLGRYESGLGQVLSHQV